MRLFYGALVLASVLFFIGCSSGGVRGSAQRVVLDDSLFGAEMPDWVKSTKVSWEDKERIYFKSNFTVTGGQRVNGCLDLAKIELNEVLLSSVKNSMKAEINLANQGIDEGLDPMITKSIQSSLEGEIRGLRPEETVFQRYKIEDTERIDCFVLASLSKSDYARLKQGSFQRLVSVSDEVKAAVQKRQEEFFQPPQ